MVETLTSANFKEKTGTGVCLVDFWAEWCGPCQMMHPILEDVAKELEGKVLVAKVNVDDYPDLAEAFKIMSIPNLFIFKNGEIVDQLIGLRGKDELIKKLNEHIEA